MPSSGPSIHRRPSLSSTARSRTATRYERGWRFPVRRSSTRNLYRISASANGSTRSEEHTSELQSRPHLVCRLLLEKKKKKLTGFELHKYESRVCRVTVI